MGVGFAPRDGSTPEPSQFPGSRDSLAPAAGRQGAVLSASSWTGHVTPGGRPGCGERPAVASSIGTGRARVTLAIPVATRRTPNSPADCQGEPADETRPWIPRRADRPTHRERPVPDRGPDGAGEAPGGCSTGRPARSPVPRLVPLRVAGGRVTSTRQGGRVGVFPRVQPKSRRGFPCLVSCGHRPEGAFRTDPEARSPGRRHPAGSDPVRVPRA